MVEGTSPTESITLEASQRLSKPYMSVLHSGIKRIAYEQADKVGIPVTRLETLVYHDPEGDYSEVVVKIYVRASARRAWQLWNSIGEALGTWKGTLPFKAQNLMDTAITEHVEWKRP